MCLCKRGRGCASCEPTYYLFPPPSPKFFSWSNTGHGERDHQRRRVGGHSRHPRRPRRGSSHGHGTTSISSSIGSGSGNSGSGCRSRSHDGRSSRGGGCGATRRARGRWRWRWRGGGERWRRWCVRGFRGTSAEVRHRDDPPPGSQTVFRGSSFEYAYKAFAMHVQILFRISEKFADVRNQDCLSRSLPEFSMSDEIRTGRDSETG